MSITYQSGIHFLSKLLDESDVNVIATHLSTYFNNLDNENDSCEDIKLVNKECVFLRKVLIQLSTYILTKGDGENRTADLASDIVNALRHANYKEDDSQEMWTFFAEKIKSVIEKLSNDEDKKQNLLFEIDRLFNAYQSATSLTNAESIDDKIKHFNTIVHLDQDIIEQKLKSSWQKNQHELIKRKMKMQNLKDYSESRLNTIEEQIRESQEQNKSFRQTIDNASDRIALLIKQLQNVNSKSDFLQDQINIVDETVTHMEKFKASTDEDIFRLNIELEEKHQNLMDLLKTIDKDLDRNLHQHQDFLERNQNFHEALEEIDDCYANFQKQEGLILSKYNIPRPEFNPPLDPAIVNQRKHRELSEKVEKLSKEKRKISFHMEDLIQENDALTADLEDLFELNTKLTNDNTCLQSQVDNLRKQVKKITNRKNADTVSENQGELLSSENGIPTLPERSRTTDITKHTELKELNEKYLNVLKQNETLMGINKKVQHVYLENEELLAETNTLHEEIESLEEKLKELEDKNNENIQEISEMKRNVDETQTKNRVLKEEFLKLKTMCQPRLLYVKTKNLDLLKFDVVNDDDGEINRNKLDILERSLVDEKDRNVTLEKQLKRLQSNNRCLLSICKKYGLDTLEIGKNYKIILKDVNGSAIITFTGVSITETEHHVFKLRNIALDEEYRFEYKKEEEYLLEELTTMLQESFQRHDEMKKNQKQMKGQIDYLTRQIQGENSIEISNERNHQIAMTTEQNDLQKLCNLLEILGINELEDSAEYVVHFQLVTESPTSKRPLKGYQHSSKPVSFDDAKHILEKNKNEVGINIRKTTYIKESISVQSLDDSLHNVLTRFGVNSFDDKELMKKITIGRDKDDLERKLRISKREANELQIRNKELKQELQHLKESRKNFSIENRKKQENSSDTSDEEVEKVETNSVRKESTNTAETIFELEHAYRLSEANCVFLERKYQEVENQLKKIEALIDQDKNESFDKSELIECLHQELGDMRSKVKISTKTIEELKKDIEYLERDVEYYKVKLEENCAVSNSPTTTTIKRHETATTDLCALKIDYNDMLKEKQYLLTQNESLTAKIKFMEAEKDFLEEKIKYCDYKPLNEEGDKTNENIVLERSPNHSIVFDHRERSTSFLVNEIKEEGLAKRFKKLEKEYSSLHQMMIKLSDENHKLVINSNLISIEAEALRITNDDLQMKILQLEKSVLPTVSKMHVTKKRKESVTAREFESKFATIEEEVKNSNVVETIKEEAMLLAHENEEIRESNENLMKRNYALRKESFAAGFTLRQLDILRERINSLENENAILKLESMKLNDKDDCRRKEFKNKISQECNIICDEKGFRKSSCIVIAKSTQADFIVSPRMSLDSANDNAMEVEELEFMIEDFTKRNTDLKSKLHALEHKLDHIERENIKLEDINNRLLDRNDELKKLVEEKENLQNLSEVESRLSDSAETNNTSLGVNLFFHSDILGEYERAEMEEQNKSLLYENRMLKENIEKQNHTIDNLNTDIKKQHERVKEAEQQISELVYILIDLQGEECVKDLLKDLGYDKDIDKISALFDKKPSVTSTLTQSIDSSEKISELDKEVTQLKKQNNEVTQKNAEYKRTVEHLERQILQMTRKFDDNSVADRSKQSLNETADEPFSVKFLMKSNKFVDVDQDSSNDLDDYQLCIEGDLTSEMEDFFKNYSTLQNKNQTLDDATDLDSSDDEKNHKAEEGEIPILQPASCEPATKISALQRFRAKENLEKALDISQEQLIEYKQRNEEFYAEILELRKKLEDTYKQKELSEKDLTTLKFSLLNAEENLSKTENKLNEMKEKYEIAVEEKQSILGNNREQEEINLDLIMTIKELEKSKAAQNTEIINQNTQIQWLEEQLCEIELEISNENQNKSDIAIEDEVMRKATNETIKDLEDEIKHMEDTLKKQEIEISDKEYTISKIASEYDDLKMLLTMESTELEEVTSDVQRKIVTQHEKHEEDLEETSINKIENNFKEIEDLEVKPNISVEELSKVNNEMEISFPKEQSERIEKKQTKSISKLSEDKRNQFTNKSNNYIKERASSTVLTVSINQKDQLTEKFEEIMSDKVAVPKNMNSREDVVPLKQKQQSASKDDIVRNLSKNINEKIELMEFYLSKESLENETTVPLDVKDQDTSTEESKQTTTSTVDSRRQAIEMSLEEGDLTLPEIFISKDSSNSDYFSRFYKRSHSLPTSRNLSIFNYPRNTNIGLSDVSDVESIANGEMETYSEDYVHKLKMKIKLTREKIREKNKIIRNQNEDIDNFLEDIREKETIITKLKRSLNEKKPYLSNNSAGFLEMETPSFIDESTRTDITCHANFPAESTNQDGIVGDLFNFADDCVHEIECLKAFIKDIELNQDTSTTGGESNYLKDSIDVLRIKLDKAREQIKNLKSKIRKCDDSNLISNVNSISEDTSRDTLLSVTPLNIDIDSVLEMPGKSVNEIRAENNLLRNENNTLRILLKDKDREINNYKLLKETESHESYIQNQENKRLELLVEKLQEKVNMMKNHQDYKSARKEEIELEIELSSQDEFDNLQHQVIGEKEDVVMKVEQDLLLLRQAAKEEMLNGVIEELCSSSTIDNNKNTGQCDDELLKTVEMLKDRLKTTELQIEKDWIIIEDQSQQLDNLHQQYIFERDENRTNSTLLKETKLILGNIEEKLSIEKNKSRNCEEQLKKMEKELRNSVEISRRKEEELGKLLQEKDLGIDNLQQMISQLEKSLINSQSHIDSIVNESFETREREIELNDQLRLKSQLIAEFEVNMLNGTNHHTVTDITQEKLIDLQVKLKDLSKFYRLLKREVTSFVQTFKVTLVNHYTELKDMCLNMNQEKLIDQYLKKATDQTDGNNSTNNIEQDNITETNLTKEWLKQEEGKNKLIQTLEKQLAHAQSIIKTKDAVNKLQIDTIIQSLAKRTNVVPRNGKGLRPTLELSKVSSRMGSSEFLKACLTKMDTDTMQQE